MLHGSRQEGAPPCLVHLEKVRLFDDVAGVAADQIIDVFRTECPDRRVVGVMNCVVIVHQDGADRIIQNQFIAALAICRADTSLRFSRT